MTSLNTAVVTIFAVFYLCTCSSAATSDAQIDHVVSACRQQCFDYVTSGLLDIGFGDCFDACVESTSSSLLAVGRADGGDDPITAKPEANDAVGSEMKRRSRHHIGHLLSSRVSPRGIGSGSASKYLRIGRKFEEVERDSGAGAAEELMDGGEKRKAWSSADKSSMSLTSKLGSKNAKNYLRVGKKSVKNVDDVV